MREVLALALVAIGFVSIVTAFVRPIRPVSALMFGVSLWVIAYLVWRIYL